MIYISIETLLDIQVLKQYQLLLCNSFSTNLEKFGLYATALAIYRVLELFIFVETTAMNDAQNNVDGN